MRISDWSSDVCSSDLRKVDEHRVILPLPGKRMSFPQNAVSLHVLKQIHLNAIETVSGPECYIVVSFKIFFDRIYPNIQLIISNIVGVAFRPEGTAQRIGACHRLLSAEDLGTEIGREHV